MQVVSLLVLISELNLINWLKLMTYSNQADGLAIWKTGSAVIF